MKKINIIVLISIIIALILSLSINVFWIYNYDYKKIDENIVFFGDSMIEIYDIEKFFPKNNVINSGISGNKTEDLIERIDKDVYIYNPSMVMILIGINDLNNEIDENDICLNIQKIISGIKANRPNATIYVQSIYPINKDIIEENNYNYANNFNNDNIKELNNKIKEICKESNVNYINVYDKLLDKEGNLKRTYTKEGLHLNNLGYIKVSSILEEYIK